MLLESVRLALGRLVANLARSALTVLGVVIGVGAIVTLVAVGNGSAANVSDQFAGLGSDTLTVAGGRGFSGGLRGAAGSGTPLTTADVAALRRSPEIAAVAPVVNTSVTVTAGATNQSATVQGTTTDAVTVDDLDVQVGRFWSDFAQSRGLPVTVLGATLASDLGLSGRTALGQTVKLGLEQFTVIGILQPKGGAGFSNPDSNALVPLRAALGRLVAAGTDLSQIRVQAAPGRTDSFGTAGSTAMRASHELTGTASDDFLVINPTTIIEANKDSSATFTRLITAVAAISLVVGGIGIANVMLVAVRERTREIGVRRAVGARRGDIVMQFLTEATVLSLLGGLLGVAVGLGLAYLLPDLANTRTVVSYPAALLAIAASGAVGVVAGVGPANQAARLEPAAALRYE
jgi:putative ABC transport system permease protein